MVDSRLSETIVLRSVQDVGRFINTRPQSRGSVLIVLIALGGVFVDAYDFTSLGIGVVQLKSQFHLSPLELGSVTAMMAFGAFLGALWGGYFTDKVGRLRMFLLDLLFLVVAAIGAGLSINLLMLLAFRFLMGIGVGLDFPVALSFIAEFVAEKRKGGSVNLWQIMWYVAASCTGLVVLPFYLAGAGSDLWRIAVGFGAIPAFIILLLRIRFMNESALWAAQNVGLEEAGRIIERTYGVSVTVDPANPAAAKSRPIASKLNFREIFNPTYRLRTTLISIICATQSMEYFAIGFNLPAISTRLFGTDFIYAILGAILFNLFGILGAAVAVTVTWRLGVRYITAIGYALVIVALVSLYLGGKEMSLTATALLIGLFIFGHSFGPGAQGMTMAALSFPTRIRGIGTGWGQSMVRIGSIFGFYFFPVLVAAIGFRSMTLVLALVPLVGLLATILIPWEPVGHDPDLTDEMSLATGD
jgi:MFS family permease